MTLKTGTEYDPRNEPLHGGAKCDLCANLTQNGGDCMIDRERIGKAKSHSPAFHCSEQDKKERLRRMGPRS